MRIISKMEFLSKKQSNTLAVMGCGYSINHIIPSQWRNIYTFDQLGMNWFCNLGVDTTFYLIREQCVAPKKLEKGSTLEDLVENINKRNTTLIVKYKTSITDNYSHVEHHDVFKHDGIIVADVPGKCKPEVFAHEDIFVHGLRHGKCTMYDALHFAVYMGYERIIFFGVDLYDFRYFWLPYDQTREIVANEGKSCNSEHNQAANTVKLIKQFKEAYPDIKLMVHNPKSLLAEHIEVWK